MNVGAGDAWDGWWWLELVSGWLEEWLWMDGGECLVEWVKMES